MKEEMEDEQNESKIKKLESKIRSDFNKSFLPSFDDKNSIDYYDIIINIDSMKSLLNGWNLKYSDSGYDQYIKQKDKKSCVVGIVGNSNKGKSFILQQLSGIQLPTGYSIKTEGLSLKYPIFDNKNIILLDSAGLETPLLQDYSYKIVESDNETSEFKQISEIARDKRVTELFLQQFIINKSNILILVVGVLTYSDQKLLNRIKRDLQNKNKKLFVVHNLSTFVTIEQVTNYIENVLLTSLTFKLEQQIMQDFNKKTNKPNKSENRIIYVEQVSDLNINNQNIVHLILANDFSEAGEFFNESAINYIRFQCICFTNIRPFPIIEKVKKYLYEISKDMMEVRIESEDDIYSEEKCIRLINRDKINLKKCLVDELGFPNFYGKAITPEYSYYKDNNFFVIELELFGEITEMKINVKVIGQNTCFLITAKKLPNKMKENPGSKYEGNQKDGLIYLELSVPLEELILQSTKLKKKERLNGLYKLYFLISDYRDGEEIILY